MIHRMLPRPARRTRARRASRILLALAAMAALISVDVPDAETGPPFGVTAQALPGASADRVGALFSGAGSTTGTSVPRRWCTATTAM